MGLDDNARAWLVDNGLVDVGKRQEDGGTHSCSRHDHRRAR